MSYETLAFLEQHRGEDPGPFARMAAETAQERAAQEREDADRAARAQARTEDLALANRGSGDPLGEISRARSVLAAVDDQVADLAEQLRKVQDKRDRVLGGIEFWTQKLAAVNDSVQRSATMGDDLLDPVKRQLAAAHREYVQASRARMAGTPRQARRPFARRGDAARSEHCVHCVDQGVDDETSYLIHSDPDLRLPVTSTREQAAQADKAEHAERRRYASHAEISR